jgi:hypothetical protein
MTLQSARKSASRRRRRGCAHLISLHCIRAESDGSSWTGGDRSSHAHSADLVLAAGGFRCLLTQALEPPSLESPAPRIGLEANSPGTTHQILMHAQTQPLAVQLYQVAPIKLRYILRAMNKNSNAKTDFSILSAAPARF